MTSSMSLQPQQPRISYKAINALGQKLNYLSTHDWRLFAANLDPGKFTAEWIEFTQFECQQPQFSPISKVLKEWQQGLSVDQEVPVQRLIEILLSIDRKDAASLIIEMRSEGTFLDPILPTSYVGRHSASPLQYQEPARSDAANGSSQHQHHQSPPCGPRDNACQPKEGRSPRQSSFHDWQDPSASNSATPDLHLQRAPDMTTPPTPPLLQRLTHAAGPVFTPTSRQMETSCHRHLPEHTPGPHSGETPQNFNRSQLSLNSDQSSPSNCFQSDPHPHRQKSGSHDSSFSTWPLRSHAQKEDASRKSVKKDMPKGTPKHRGTCQSEESNPTFSQLEQEAVHSYIPPLQSYSGVTSIPNGASPYPVFTPNQRKCFLITYAYKSYKKAFQLGIALKEQGQEVLTDTKMKDASDDERRTKTHQLYQRATHIVIIFNLDYIQEVFSNVQSPLNTRLIYRWMDQEFSQHGNNVRFVPIIDHKRISPANIPPLFCNTPRHSQEFVFKALRDYNTTQPETSNEVSIERVVYTSH